MAWVKIDDQARTHRKILSAGAVGAWLWTCGLMYCNAQKARDGFIPEAAVAVLYPIAGWRREAARLVSIGLWERVDGGYIVHDYHEYQPTAEEAERQREQKAAAGRAGGLLSGERRRSKSEADDEANPKRAASTAPPSNETPLGKSSNKVSSGFERNVGTESCADSCANARDADHSVVNRNDSADSAKQTRSRREADAKHAASLQSKPDPVPIPIPSIGDPPVLPLESGIGLVSPPIVLGGDGAGGAAWLAWREGVSRATEGNVSPLDNFERSDLVDFVNGHAAPLGLRDEPLMQWIGETAEAFVRADTRRGPYTPKRCKLWLDSRGGATATARDEGGASPRSRRDLTADIAAIRAGGKP